MAPIPRADAGALLAQAVVADAQRAGLVATVRDWRSHPWASATFVGARHAATVSVAGDAAAWIAALPDAELVLRGHLVADLVATGAGGGTVAIEALTIDSA